MNYDFKRKILSICLVLISVLTIMMSNYSNINAYATKTIEDEGVVTNVKNSANGKLTFLVRVPAGKKAEWSVKLKHWDNRNVYLDTHYGTVKNSGNKTKKMSVSVDVNYYSPKYKVSASYTIGVPRLAKTYKDTDNAKSVPQLSGKVKIRKFVWNDSTIKKYKNSQAIARTFVYAGTIAFDLVLTKGATTGFISAATAKAIGAGVSASGFAYDMVTTLTKKEYSMFKKVLNEPVEGWGYTVYAIPCENGFYYSVSVYDDKNKLYKTVKYQTITGNVLSRVVR